MHDTTFWIVTEQASQVCKYSEKTKQRKQRLSSQTKPFLPAKQKAIIDDEAEDYPVPYVRGSLEQSEQSDCLPREVGKRSMSAHRTSDLKQRSSGNELKLDDCWADVSSSSTVLAPLSSRPDYIGPGLFRSRITTLKRASSMPNAASVKGDTAKRPKIDYSMPSDQCEYFTRTSMHFPGYDLTDARRMW